MTQTSAFWLRMKFQTVKENVDLQDKLAAEESNE